MPEACFLSTLYYYPESISKIRVISGISLTCQLLRYTGFLFGWGFIWLEGFFACLFRVKWEVFQDPLSQPPNNMHSEITVNIAHFEVNFLKTEELITWKHGYFSRKPVGCFSTSNKNLPYKEQVFLEVDLSYILLNQTVKGVRRNTSQNSQIHQGKVIIVRIILNTLNTLNILMN